MYDDDDDDDDDNEFHLPMNTGLSRRDPITI
jgi:hypothetical protein